MRHRPLVALLVLALAACGSSDDGADPGVDPTTTGAPAEPTGTEPTATEPVIDEPADEPAVPGPGDAVGTLTGPDVDIAVVGTCDYDVSDLASADIAFADVRGIDPSGVEWPVRFGLSGSPDRNTQLNVNGSQVVVRWSEPGLLEQATDDGSYLLDTTIGRLVATTADGYELNISCFER
ncbi:MAG: hypothetical protein ACLGHQ_05745 [Acidimicrobiia bacterium]